HLGCCVSAGTACGYSPLEWKQGGGSAFTAYSVYLIPKNRSKSRVCFLGPCRNISVYMEYITIMLSSEQRLLFQLYAAQGRGKFLFFLSPVPLFDFNYLAGKEFDLFFPVVSPLPLGLAASIFKDLCGTNFKKGSPKLLLEKIRNLCSRELGRRGLPAAQEE